MYLKSQNVVGDLWWEGIFCRVALRVWLARPGVAPLPLSLAWGHCSFMLSLSQMIQKHQGSFNPQQSSLG